MIAGRVKELSQMAKKLSHDMDISPGHHRSTSNVIEILTAPEAPREISRAWLSSLSLDEIKSELAWILDLIEQKKDGTQWQRMAH